MVFADKMKQKHLATFATLLLCHSSVSGFTAPTKRALVINKNRFNVARPLSSFEDSSDSPRESTNNDAESSGIGSVSLAPLIPSALALFTALPADAAGVVPTALWAYAHYVSILVVMASLVGQRVLVKAGMSDEEEDTLQIFDAVYGVSALLLIVSGYYRVTEFGKGADFYVHEPLFWLKMGFVGVWAGLSVFPTITFIKRTLARKSSEVVPPMTEKLASRLKTVITAEISAILSIPLAATFMARGVLYSDDFPLPAGIALVALLTGGSFYSYGKQALTWSEDASLYVAEKASVVEKE